MSNKQTECFQILKSSGLLEVLKLHAKLYEICGVQSNWWLAKGSGLILNFTFEDVNISCLWIYDKSNNCYNSWDIKFQRDEIPFGRIDVIDGVFVG